MSNDGKATNIFYSIKEGPFHGFIAVNNKTNAQQFTQNDINSLSVSYIQKNKTASDYFIVDVESKNKDKVEKSINNITVMVAVRPMVRAKKPFLVASPGQKTIITQEYLDARF